MKKVLPYLFFAFLTLTAFNTWAKDQGEVQLFAFQNGLPLSGVAVYQDTQLLGKTDEAGSLLISLPVGKQKIQLKHQDKSLTELQLNIQEGEEIELLIPITKNATIEDILTESNQEEDLKAGEALAEESEELKPEATQKVVANAVIEGQISSVETQIGIPGVNIYVTGISQKIKTDANGFFKVDVPPGDYALSAVHADYSAQTVKKLEIKANQKITQNLELTPAAEQLEEFVVTAPALEGGILALMEEKKKSSSVTEVLSSAQMSTSGDSTAGDALKRVTGITYVGGKYVYVRGMGDRYSSTLLNKAGLPSPEPTKKVVPLDLFPTAMIGSITVQKSYSPDIPADFGGGVVLLKTKTIPEERKQKIKLSLGGNSQSTGANGLGYQGGSTDILGIDDGTRALPTEVQSFIDNPPGRFDADAADRTEAAGKSLPVNYKMSRKPIGPDFGFQVDLADVNEQYGENWSWGYNFSFGYKNKTRHRKEYGEENINSDPTIDDVENVKEKTRQTIDLAGMLNLMFEIGNNNKFDTTTIVSRKTTNTVTLQDKYESESTSNFKNYSLVWEERQLISQQFHGIHTFPSAEDLELEWQTTFSNAKRIAPDSRFYQYAQSADTSGTIDPYSYQTVGDSNSRTWEYLNDNAISFTMDLRKPFYSFLGSMGSWDNGFALDLKDRESDVYKTRWAIPNATSADLTDSNPEGFLNDSYIGGTNSDIKLTDYTQSTDSYTATQSIQAFYTKLTSKWSSGFSLMTGVRMESSSQSVKTILSAASGEEVENILEETHLLPAFSLGYAISPEFGQVRFAFAQTLNRPDLKELSEARYLNPEDDKYYVGNPDLKIAQISHFDFRWEKYITSFENVSVAYFIKDFVNPIELTQEPGGGTVDSFTYNNVASAVNQGIELQGRIWLRRLLGNYFSRFYIESNASLIESQVDLSDAENYIGTNSKRALQGQSPWVFNLNLGYKNLVKDINASLVLNMTGPSIAEVGVNGEDDTYLQTPPSLNFVYNQLLYQGHEDKWKFKAKVQNLLDGEYKEVVGEDGFNVTKRYKKGISFSAEVSYSWK